MIDKKKPSELKLAKLPNRKAVKLTITLSAELAARVRAYAEAYRETYGEAEDVATLVPYIVTAFIESDRTFAKTHGRAPDAAQFDETARLLGTFPKRSSRPQ